LAGQRRLAAIMFTDMVGYTALGQRDESLSLALVEEQRKLMRPVFSRHNGREIKTMGDAFLVEFASALNAVRCAYDIQRATMELNSSVAPDRRFSVRIGIHVGDVIDSGDDVLGDAVNVASRIEPLAEDGGVCLSRQVYDHVQNKFERPLTSLGLKTLKNVANPVEVYKVVMPWEDVAPGSGPGNARRIAVMPFANMSADPSDEYFADGMTEELISTMSKVEQFEVISRTSVMQFKKNPKPIREISRELDAGTVIEGSVRKSGSKVRVTVQMIDAARDRHTWTESYDRELEDIFSIQSEISNAVADELKVRIVPSQRARLEKEPTTNAEAFNLYLKGRFFFEKRTKEGLEKAIQYFDEATKRDPDYARAYAGLADCYMIQENWGYISPAEAHLKRRDYARKALELDRLLPEAHVALATSLSSGEWDWAGAEREFKRAIELNPNYATAHHWYGNGLLGPSGRHAEAIAELKEAMRLDPLSQIISSNLGDQLLSAGRYGEAEEQYRKVLETAPDFAYARARLGLALLKEARYAEAISEITEAMRLSDRSGNMTPDLIYAFRIAGRRDDAEHLLDELEKRSTKEYVSSVALAMANGAAGRNERAIGLLQKAAAERSNQLRMNIGEPHFDEVHSDPRFQTLLTALGIRTEN
jgi:adenylate cyclase